MENVYALEKSDGIIIDAANPKLSGGGRYVNHSCRPNSEFVEVELTDDCGEEEKKPNHIVVFVIAVKPICIDQEITVSYDRKVQRVGIKDQYKPEKCLCANRPCSGIVGVSPEGKTARSKSTSYLYTKKKLIFSS